MTWFTIYDYGHRLEGLRDGTGSFYNFASTNAAGVMKEWVQVNGGLIDRTPGKEQGDLDLIISVDGKVSGASLVGNMTEFGGPPSGLVPIRDTEMNLGGASTRWKDLFFSGQLNTTTVGKQISINGVVQWIDCILVNTQQGVRAIPTFEILGG